MRDLGARNEILSMRSRMWCRWHVTDKPPQNGTRQEDTMGIHPLNRPQTAQPREGGEGRGGVEGRVQASQPACAQQAGMCM